VIEALKLVKDVSLVLDEFGCLETPWEQFPSDEWDEWIEEQVANARDDRLSDLAAFLEAEHPPPILPEYVPEGIRRDFAEGWAIRHLSGRASATLSRRAIQGMIRDFWSVSGKRTLKQEIEAIRDRVEPEVWAAIDAVREIGNIGAHMEEDIDLIIEVDPEEAEVLLALLGMLVKEWYVARHTRLEHLARMEAMAAEKKAIRARGLVPKSQAESGGTILDEKRTVADVTSDGSL